MLIGKMSLIIALPIKSWCVFSSSRLLVDQRVAICQPPIGAPLPKVRAKGDASLEDLPGHPFQCRPARGESQEDLRKIFGEYPLEIEGWMGKLIEVNDSMGIVPANHVWLDGRSWPEQTGDWTNKRRGASIKGRSGSIFSNFSVLNKNVLGAKLTLNAYEKWRYHSYRSYDL